MSKAQLPQRRTLLIGLAAAGLVPLSGCMTKPLRPSVSRSTEGHAPPAAHPEPSATSAARQTHAVSLPLVRRFVFSFCLICIISSLLLSYVEENVF